MVRGRLDGDVIIVIVVMPCCCILVWVVQLLDQLFDAAFIAAQTHC